MALSPTDYQRAARPGLSAGANDAEGMPIAPLREASPADDDAPPSIGAMVSRSGEATFIPERYLDYVTPNDDPILAKDGNGLKLYEALLSDDTVASTLQQRRLAITSRDFTVGPGDDKDPLSVRAADDFRAMLDELPFDDATGGLHYAVMFGYGVGEGMFEIREHDGRQIVWLTDIVVPDRRWFGFNAKGELRYTGSLGVPGVTTGFGDNGEVPPNKFVTIRTGGTHDFAFYGLGLGHWLYWPVFFKRAAIKFWALYLEKRANPTTAIEFTEGQKDDPKAKGELLAAAVAVGKDSAVLLPEGTMKNERLKILEGVNKSGGTSDYKEFLGAQDEAIMRVVLGQPGTSKATPGGLGGDGQAKKDEGVKREIVKADSDLISGAINRTFARWVTLWNYGPGVKPPKVWRELDDSEDLNTVADRDVKLDGIGIKRTEESVAEVYGAGYVLERETPEEKLARETALIVAKQGAAPPAAGGNVVDLAAERKRRVTEFMAEFGIDDEVPLYVSRKLLNGAALAKWAADNGLTPTVPTSDMHVTVLYSKTPVDPFAMGETWIDMDGKGGLTVKEGGPRALKRFNGGAVVLRFASADLSYRHSSMIERGASSDYPEYKPHVTLSYDVPEDFDLSAITPYDGELRFGPEIFEPIRPKEFDASTFNFAAADEDAIDRLVTALLDETNPVFAAMASGLKDALQGVTTVEGARIAIVEAAERFDINRLAELTALPMLAVRADAVVAGGVYDTVKAGMMFKAGRGRDHDENDGDHKPGGKPRANNIFKEEDHPRDGTGRFMDKADIDEENKKFDAFFAGSKIVDADGKPMPIYHGTVHKFDEFDLAHGGKNTGAGYSGTDKAIYFTNAKSEAGHYIDVGNANRAKNGQQEVDGRIVTAYANVQRPLVLNGKGIKGGPTKKEVDAMMDNDGAAVLYAQRNGYDGVIWPHGNAVNSGYTLAVLSPRQIAIKGGKIPDHPGAIKAPPRAPTKAEAAAQEHKRVAGLVGEGKWTNVNSTPFLEAMKKGYVTKEKGKAILTPAGKKLLG